MESFMTEISHESTRYKIQPLNNWKRLDLILTEQDKKMLSVISNLLKYSTQKLNTSGGFLVFRVFVQV